MVLGRRRDRVFQGLMAAYPGVGVRIFLAMCGYGPYFRDLSDAEIDGWSVRYGMNIVMPHAQGVSMPGLMGWSETLDPPPDPRIPQIPFDWDAWWARPPHR